MAYAGEAGLTIDWSRPGAVLELSWSYSGATSSPLAVLAQTLKEFDFPGIPWPPQFHYTGPFHDVEGREPIPFPLGKAERQAAHLCLAGNAGERSTSTSCSHPERSGPAPGRADRLLDRREYRPCHTRKDPRQHPHRSGSPAGRAAQARRAMHYPRWAQHSAGSPAGRRPHGSHPPSGTTGTTSRASPPESLTTVSASSSPQMTSQMTLQWSAL